MTESLSRLTAINPLEGRYYKKVEQLSDCFSEYALMRNRLTIEIEWFKALANNPMIPEISKFSPKAIDHLHSINTNFDVKQAQLVKDIEAKTNHDVKAIEYYLKQSLADNPELSKVSEFVHFTCTSEDINNLAHGLMLKQGINQALIPAIEDLLNFIDELANRYASTPMLSRTHGQTASPTTVGKEFRNVYWRLDNQFQQIKAFRFYGKINGAVGNYNAHVIAYEKLDWPEFAKSFVNSLGLDWNSHTIQIEPHDYMAEIFHTFCRFNTILLDINKDCWGYISLGYFKQKISDSEVGSSTMPHKINPIDFENSEGNLGLANALFTHLAEKLPISRWQRDLSDSTVIRNIGVAFGYSLISYQATLKGLKKIELNNAQLEHDLNSNWEVITEAIQTIMRKHKIENAYEKLKHLTRSNQQINQASLTKFINSLDIPEDDKSVLLKLTPSNYIGLASTLAKL